jgi:hypothetical protein
MTPETSKTSAYLAEWVNMEATKKVRGRSAARDEVARPALRPVILHHAIARHGNDGLRLLHVPLGFGEEALVVFSSRETARRYCLSRRHFLPKVFGEEWHERVCSAGELVSLLLGPYEGLDWVLLDPRPGMRVVEGGTQEADLMSRERFVDQLLEQALPVTR